MNNHFSITLKRSPPLKITLIINETLEEYKTSPVDILGIGDGDGEYAYLQNLKNTYLRTITDVNKIFSDGVTGIRILEIGSFLGAVSIALKKIGYEVYSTDIPEFKQSKNLRAKYEKYNIPFEGINLHQNKLPYEDDFFDAVVICEVIEHLNFNPLPIFQEINRILKKEGHVYIGMPNQASITNRINLLRGKSIHNPVQHFFSQLDKSKNMIVGLHWREYTLSETIEILGKMGFQIKKAYYFNTVPLNNSWLKSILDFFVYIVPSFRHFQVVIGQKCNKMNYSFWLTDANS